MKIGSVRQYKLKNITLSVEWTVPGLSKCIQKHTSKKGLNHYFYNSFLFLVAIFPLPFRISFRLRSVIISDYRK